MSLDNNDNDNNNPLRPTASKEKLYPPLPRLPPRIFHPLFSSESLEIMRQRLIACDMIQTLATCEKMNYRLSPTEEEALKYHYGRQYTAMAWYGGQGKLMGLAFSQLYGLMIKYPGRMARAFNAGLYATSWKWQVWQTRFFFFPILMWNLGYLGGAFCGLAMERRFLNTKMPELYEYQIARWKYRNPGKEFPRSTDTS
jgi:hypothetical protein